jgi:hypothetical protein
MLGKSRAIERPSVDSAPDRPGQEVVWYGAAPYTRQRLFTQWANAAKYSRKKISPYLPYALIAVGMLLRLRQYFFDRSLWLDEAFLSLDIRHDSFSQLWGSQRHSQVAPVGFLTLEKAMTNLLGNSEYAFRLVPLLAGLVALPLFYRLAKKFLAPFAVLVALGLFALSGPLIYYSSETKEYMLGVLVAVVLYATALPMVDLKWQRLGPLCLGFVGALAIWFSFPAVFVLGGICLTLLIAVVLRKQWSALYSLAFPLVLCVVSFGLSYWLIVRRDANHPALFHYWSGSFLPFPPLSYKDVAWYASTLFRVFDFPVGIAATGLAVALFSIACASLFRRNRISLTLLLAPIVLTLAASAIHKYPFSGRLILFLVPIPILLIAEGCDYLRSRCSSTLVPAAVVGVLFFVPTFSALHRLIRPETVEEIRPVIGYVQTHEKPGDVLYLYHPASYAFRFYDENAKLGGVMIVTGQASTGNWKEDTADIGRLRGDARVWFLFSHVRSADGMNEESFFLYVLNSYGKQLASFQAPGAAVYLYNLSHPQRISRAPGSLPSFAGTLFRSKKRKPWLRSRQFLAEFSPIPGRSPAETSRMARWSR